MNSDINIIIDEIVKNNNITYMEAILKYTENIDGEIEAVAKVLNKSIKDKLEMEAQELHMMKKKSTKLPIQYGEEEPLVKVLEVQPPIQKGQNENYIDIVYQV